MDAEADFANYDVAVGLGVERLHREVEGVCNTIHKIYKQMVAVNGTHSQCDGVESIVSFEID